MPATLNQDAFRFRRDNGGEQFGGALWLASTNTAISHIADINTRLRFAISNTGDHDKNNLQCQLQYSHNSGGWFPVDALSSVARMSDSIHLTKGADTTQQLLNTLTFDTSNGGQEDTDGLTLANSLVIDTRIEVEYCFKIRSVDIAAFDTVDFRVTSSGAALDNYNTPTVRIIALEIPPIPGSMTLTVGSGTMKLTVRPLEDGA